MGAPMGFARRSKKFIIVGIGVAVLLGILFLGLGLGGVFNAATTVSPGTTTPAATTPGTTTVAPATATTQPSISPGTVTTTQRPLPPATVPPPVTPIPGRSRIECLPDKAGLNSQQCFNAGCSWEELTEDGQHVPFCYVNKELMGYKLSTIGVKDARLQHYSLEKIQPNKLYSEPFAEPWLKVEKKSQTTLNFKFFDAATERYEVPIGLNKLDPENIDEALYEFRRIGDRETGIQIVRKSTGAVLFDMSLGGLFLEDQFLQITTRLPSDSVYGFGDNRHNTLRHKMDWKTWPMFSRDAPPTNPNSQDNLYGVHPFYMCLEDDGNAFGVFLLNSNAMEYKFQPDPALTLRSIGGVFDFYIFLGPTPEDVVRQYTDLLGKSFMPPYWGLGFQISRWGFRDLDHVKEVVKRVTDAKIPLDAVYGDIDYMRHRQDFTYDLDKYDGLPEYVKELHDKNMKYVIILDPAIHVDAATKHPGDPPYEPYSLGVERDIFIKWPKKYLDANPNQDPLSIGKNRAMLGKVWPDGRSAFPDFFQSTTLNWWEEMITKVYRDQKIEFDALWLDMNEVSSFDTNEDATKAWYCGKPEELSGDHTCFALQCPKDNLLECPPYNPMAARIWVRTDPANPRPDPMLSDKTLCMIGETKLNGKTYRQYDVHSLYGYSQAEVSFRVVQNIRKERSFVFSRSTYPGAQKFVGHWGGDNAANYQDLRYSVINLLEYSMFGFSYVGSDICGFFDVSSPELCKKWSVVGAFYPFSRNHNAWKQPDQDPATHPDVAEAAKVALEIRYSLLPYLYTLFYRSHVFGDTVSRPLHHVYPKDMKVRDLADQFFWGPALMISPVVDQADKRHIYLPEPMYDYYDGTLVQGTVDFTWKSPHFVGLHLRPGFIIPRIDHAATTEASRRNPFRLLAAVDKDHVIARGELYWDDGKGIDNYQGKRFFLAEFSYNNAEKLFTLHVKNRPPNMNLSQGLVELTIYGPHSYVGKEIRVHANGIHDPSFAVATTDKIVTIRGNFPRAAEHDEFTIRLVEAGELQPTLIDCAPDGANAEQCRARACVWVEQTQPGRPWCTFPSGLQFGHILKTGSPTSPTHDGPPVVLLPSPATSLTRPNAHAEVWLTIQEISNNIIRLTYSGTRADDPASSAPVPEAFAQFAYRKTSKPTNPVYQYQLDRNPTSGTVAMKVRRASTETVIFNTEVAPLIYANQFREITTKLPSTYAYGIGEHSRKSFRHDFSYKSWGMFARDQPPGGPQNLYGVHPYVQIVEDDAGRAYGMLLLNAHAMEATFSPTPAITFRTVGGNLDFFLILGSSPSDVNSLYMDLIGKPFLPPYWALGFQISRYGYNTFENMQKAVERTLKAEIPLDIFYGDIDFFDREMGFTIGEAFKDLPKYVDAKLTTGLRFVTIQDPCIPALTSQDTFKRGIAKRGVFIEWPENYVDTNQQSYQTIDPTKPKYLLGHVWPRDKVVFVDFFNPVAHDWWSEEVKIFYDKIKYSALWIDMNEPANFGTNMDEPDYDNTWPLWPWSLKCPSGPYDHLDRPPVIPRSLAISSGSSGRLSDKTICMTAQQSDGKAKYNHYDVHNLYGHSQIGPSLRAMEKVTGERSFVFSRSTFIGSGTQAGHWLGDNFADYNQLRQSVIGMMEFNIFGIPYVGADICGYFGTPDAQLCIRWMQLGAFYPFSRNHNGKDTPDQDPAAFPEETEVARASKLAIDRRYRLLPYLYTLFGQANRVGATVVKSLMEVFPTDLQARDVDRQFMWGDALLVTPVLEKDATTVTAYFPKGDWYDYETGAELTAEEKSKPLPVELMSIPLHLRGGHIIPAQSSATNTQASSKTPYSLRVAPDKAVPGQQKAKGYLFWDGGLEIRTEENKDHFFGAEFSYELNVQEGSTTNYKGSVKITLSNPFNLELPRLDNIRVTGYPKDIPAPSRVMVLLDDTLVTSSAVIFMDPETLLLRIENLNLRLDGAFGNRIHIEFINYPSEPVGTSARIECLPDVTTAISWQDCTAKGCSWEKTAEANVPGCYVNKDLIGFKMTRLPSSKDINVEQFSLASIRKTQLYSTPFSKPTLKVEKKSATTLNFKFFDDENTRYEVPVPLNPLIPGHLDQALYEFRLNGDRETGIQIIRKATGTVLFDLGLGGLTLEDQFLQITTKLPSTYVYGFGDNRHNTFRHKMDWKTWPMFSRDAPPADVNRQDNLYGVHPFYMCLEDDGNAFGVFLLNSNAMEYKFQPTPALTLRSIGGVFDFHIFLGPTPEDVVRQYTDLLGKSFMPPYWGLGFQISRWGFRDLAHVKEVVDRVTAAGIPLDAVYGDIDYMHHRQDFTVDPINYGELSDYVKELHDKDMKYVIILDPAIHADAATKHPADGPYEPFIQGVAKDIFIKWPQAYLDANPTQDPDSIGPNNAMLGKVWPDGRSAFPDFYQESTKQWWTDMITKVYVDQNIKFDALWLDMNEVSSFDTNEDASQSWYCGKPDELPGDHTCFALQCPKNDPLENPPYKPMASRNWVRTEPANPRPDPMLSDKTLCMIGESKIDGKIYRQYDIHSLYGYSQAEISFNVAKTVRKERSFVFSRSTYPGAQKYVGHWGGDNAANYQDMRYSIINLLEYSLFGFSYVGSDICGFFDPSSPELCKKWSVVGAFYPFSRNHNAWKQPDQDPATHGDVREAAKTALQIRYTLLPYLYTLFYRSHVFGDTVSRPLHHIYSKDMKARDIADQFFWGPALMISPIVDEADEREIYLPETMYDYYDGTAVQGTVNFAWRSPNFVGLHLRPGFIIPRIDHGVTTEASRKNPFRLLAVVDEEHPVATGELFFDDGKGIDTVTDSSKHFRAEFSYDHTKQLFYFAVRNRPANMEGHGLVELTVIGPNNAVGSKPIVQANGLADDSFTVTGNDKIMHIRGTFPSAAIHDSYFVRLIVTGASLIDCAPESTPSAVQCRARGCIWVGGTNLPKRPKCAFPDTKQTGYILKENSPDTPQHGGPSVVLQPNAAAVKARPNPHTEVHLTVQEISDNILRITYTGRKTDDPANSAVIPKQYAKFAWDSPDKRTNPVYQYQLDQDDTTGIVAMKVRRRETETVIFNTEVGPLIYANQYREITTKVPSTYAYGIGEHSRNSFRHNFNYQSWGMFARDQPPGGPQNLYGVHPYVQIVEDDDGRTYGILLLNAHAMETAFTPIPAITYRTIGGNLDFFLFVGDNPSHVNSLYTGLIGKPFLPPYWSLGFQISRYGYNSFDNMEAAVERTLKANIPLDLFYGDIDYFDGKMGFTISDRFNDLPKYVEDKLKDGLRFVTIQDPCIAAITTQDTFKRGLATPGVFIEWPENYVDTNEQSYKTIDPDRPPYLLGHVWPRAKSVFVDFFNPVAHTWWSGEVRLFYEKIKYSALWIDMNEPANFGTNQEKPEYDNTWPLWPWSLKCPSGPTDFLDNPPFLPKSLASITGRLSDRTICMTAQQSDGTFKYDHYDVHNLYGHSQIAPSLKAMEAVLKERSFVFSRSTFVGSGTGAGHWLGDNTADFDQLRQSIIGIMDFNLFGIPYVGADICGYFGDSEPELCIRWMQLGAFYPFSRNHNGKGFQDQDPAAYPEETKVAEASKIAIDRRYRLLPYLYTLFSHAALSGQTVVKSLMEVFPNDPDFRDMDTQFMWGEALMITPVLAKGIAQVRCYFPKGDWFDFETGAELTATQKALPLPVTLMNIPLHVRGGFIIPMQDTGKNTRESSKSPYTLWIAPDKATFGQQKAKGDLFWDGGVRIRDEANEDEYFTAEFTYELKAEPSSLTRYLGAVKITIKNAFGIDVSRLATIRIGGFPKGVPPPNLFTVALDDTPVISPARMAFNDATQVITFTDLNLALDGSSGYRIRIEFINYPRPIPPPLKPVPGKGRIDCLPDKEGLTRDDCAIAGCTWEELTEEGQRIPWCYVNPDRTGYRLTAMESTDNLKQFALTPLHQKSFYSTPFTKPQLMVEKKSVSTLHFKLFDSQKQRYEVPIPLKPLSDNNLADSLYEFRQIGDRDTGIQIIRRSTGTVVFDMGLGGLLLEDQFLQITTKLPSVSIYGFGDNRHNTLRHQMDWKTWPMFSRDAPPTNANSQDNLYGVHPFYMCLEDDGSAFGVFLLNSNAMEYKFQPDPALTLRSIGGVFDFYIFLGPTPEDVVRQYTDLLGKSFMPPYWGLGFQISRWGFRDLAHVKEVVDRVTAAGIPLDAVYGDIDYMHHRQDFTVDPINYDKLSDYIKDLHAKDMKYVIILDPAIHADAATKHPADGPYAPYLQGVEKGIYINWPQGYLDANPDQDPDSIGPKNSMLGKVWPDGRSAFPDFFRPDTLQWWEDMITDVYERQDIKFDALWLDMNEVSSFDTNEDASQSWYCGRPEELPGVHTCFALQCPKNNLLENPPYKPMAARIWRRNDRPNPMLSDKTLCMIGETIINGKVYTQYDVHSLYGYSQAEVSYRVAQKIRKERSFVFSRSTYPGAQQYVGHWGGDNAANYQDLRYSIINLLEYSMFGFSYVGSDICGFFDPSSPELCKKWSVVGAFYPFSRNHNAWKQPDQDPATHPDVAEAAKAALEVRYSLLPYLYTLFYRSHVFGDTVSRPLHHVYPQDVNVRDLVDQFFWGPAMMISPILDETNERHVYLPETMYDYYDGSEVKESAKFQWKDPNFVALHLRAGFVIPRIDHAVTTEASRKNPFRLLAVANEEHPIAQGELYSDDGKGIDNYEGKQYFHAEFTYDRDQLLFTFTVKNRPSPVVGKIEVSELTIYGPHDLAGRDIRVLVNDTPDDNLKATVTDGVIRIGGPFPSVEEDNSYTIQLDATDIYHSSQVI